MTMGSRRSVWCILVLVITASDVILAEDYVKASTDTSEFGYELVLQRLDQLQFSFLEVFVHIKELSELVVNNQRTIEQNQLQTNQLVQNLEHQVAANVFLMTSYFKKILDLQSICANHDSIRQELYKFNPNFKSNSYKFPTKNANLQVIKSCSQVDLKISGLYNMSIASFKHPVEVFCEMEKFGGHWLVIQHRFDGSVDFQRNWTDYKTGFGTVGKEFWLGLEKIHQITQQGSSELLIELETFGGNYTYAQYSEFEIGSESEKYALKKLGTYNGTAGDQMTYHLGMKFSTLDSDNDKLNENCALIACNGGWWYKDCSDSNLNGKHSDQKLCNHIYWRGIDAGLKFSRMMIRLK